MGLPIITLISPTNLENSTLPTIHFDAKYEDIVDNLVASSVIYEVDTVNTFDSQNLKTVTYLDVAHATALKYIITLTNGTWYWRVTATNTDGTTISNVFTLTVSQIMKRALYQYENIAKYGPDWAYKRALYQYENIAKYGPDWTGKRALYQYEAITDEPPFPWIESLSTLRANAGAVITITGNGFGYKYDIDTANADRFLRGYGGYVFIGGMLCNIISWSWTEIVFQIPPDAESGAVIVQLTAPTVRDSNAIGLEVISSIADNIGLEFFICDRTNPNTVLAQLDGAKGKAFQTLLNNPGSGRFSISRYDPKGSNRDYIKDQNYILCRLDGVDVFKWIIEGRKPNYITSDEQQVIEISGRGVLAMLEWAVVYPTDLANPTLDREFTGSGAKILNDLIWEAQNRGGLVGVNCDDWTTTHDSLGNEFTDNITISFRVGTPLLEVIKKFSEGLGLFDVEMTPELKLRIFKIKGDDKYDEIRYRPGQAILEHQNQSDATKVVNTVLVEGSDGRLAVATHATSQNEWGRREGYLQASNVRDGLSEYGQSFLNRAAYAYWGIQGSVVEYVDSKGKKLKPFESFLVGDWIGWYIPPEGSDLDGFDGKLRVKGITVDEDDDTGALNYTLELNNIMLENEIKTVQAVQRLSGFSENDVLANPGGGSSGGISEIPQATEMALGGIKAMPRDDGDTQEVKIDVETGRLYTSPSSSEPGGGAGLLDGLFGWMFDEDVQPQIVGVDGNGSLSGSSYSDFTTGLLLGKAIKVSNIYWYVGVANTWSLLLDDEQIGESVVTTGAQTIDFSFTSLAIPSGAHTLKLKPLTNARMQFINGSIHIDRWLRIDNWLELPGYRPPLKIKCVPGDFREL